MKQVRPRTPDEILSDRFGKLTLDSQKLVNSILTQIATAADRCYRRGEPLRILVEANLRHARAVWPVVAHALAKGGWSSSRPDAEESLSMEKFRIEVHATEDWIADHCQAGRSE